MKALKYEDRVKRLSELMLFISFARECIAYLSLSTEEIVRRCVKREDISKTKLLRELHLCDIEERGFFEPWKQAISTLRIEDNERSVLLTWGEGFGKTDRENQILSCDQTLSRLERIKCYAEEEFIKQGRMWTSLGVIGGLFTVILLI